MYRHKCPKCKADIEHTEKYNLETGKTRNKPPIYFPIRNLDGTFNIRNMFKVRIMTIVIIILILYSAWSYQKDMSMCEEAQTHPCEFCRQTGCMAKVMIENIEVEEFAADKIEWIPELSKGTD